ncbi:hypothetical protein [Haloarcula litorea]|uniref:hypothetical protein n=1 Tax=Haloarcula litorea TaxID=3032579 RepID=UPI0023E82017|nr:hypothetical protein [Halomicroarcula sp. GDY20]
MTDEPLDRRAVLGALAGAGAASVAGCSILGSDASEGDGTATPVDDGRARELAERFAPTLYFDTAERWFPTDPRPYTSQRDGETIVDGFDALNGYHERFSGDQPPEPTVFYRALAYEDSPLSVVQFWFYSAFDQFTTNFHWHDWEVLHVFVDTETGEPRLHVASSHSRKVPNNEFLDPDPERTPRILSELGSHSSALSINEIPDQFTRLAEGDLLADITNNPIETLADVATIPFAYGLPRDEGAALPYVIPEYEGEPLYEHDRLPAVERSDLVPPELTVRSFDALSSPPSALPTRENGLVFQHADREGGAEADIEYDLVPTAEIEDIADFTGPQLSFEFAVPEAAEDAVASHITTTGAPWNQSRYDNPAADITEPNHRAALADSYDAIAAPPEVNTVVASLAETVPDPAAPEDAGVTTEQSGVEGVALLESDPEAVPTFRGVAAVRDVPAGDHRLTVNRAGTAPYSETVRVGDESGPETATGDGTATEGGTAGDSGTAGGGRTLAGVDGRVPLVANERARKLTVEAGAADSDLTGLAVEDDFGGRLYEVPPADSETLYVHDGGAYTTAVRDSDDAVGAYRVNPDPAADGAVRIDDPSTGKASIATFLVAVARETQTDVAAFLDAAEGLRGRANAVRGLSQALGAVVDAAERAAERARAGDAAGADQQLATVADRLRRIATLIERASDALGDPLTAAARNRLEQAQRRTEQGREMEKL